MNRAIEQARPLRAAPAVAFCLALAAAALMAGCGRSDPKAGAAGGHGGPGGGAMPPLSVSVVTVQPQTVPVTVEAVATIEGLREVEVRARVAGILQQQLYREGEAVAAGTPLFRIERAPMENNVESARAAVVQAEVRAEQARRETGRLAGLVADRAISQREADDAASTAKTADAALLAARAQLRDAQLNLGYTEITAPIAGVVQRAQRSVGTLVSPTADSGMLTTIVQLDPIRVRFALSEGEAALVRQGKGRQVRLLGADGQPSQQVGRLDFAGSVVDPQLGTVQMRAEIANPGQRWLPGQFVRAQIVTGEQQAFLVPQAAVQSGDQGRFVWVIGPGGKAAVKPVQAGSWSGSNWVIRSGLAAGDQVITDNLLKLRPGAPVQAAPAGGPAGAPPGATGAPGAPGAPGASAPAAAPAAASAPAAAASK
ncbi:MAG: efflux RND transporter periplasmic adaptor subunit [Proteobacteria bacterium]|nr:efflux RND transporter periplasmic adaptor subunit [Pseudomonadota bacterium]